MQIKFFALATVLATTFATSSATTPETTPWGVGGFKRDCTDPKTCIYHLDIWAGKSPQHCTITDKGDPATRHPWFGKSCTEKNGFYLSWGWDYPKNFTVLTVDDQKNKIRAFFGYDRPNDGLPVVTYDDKVSFAQYY